MGYGFQGQGHNDSDRCRSPLGGESKALRFRHLCSRMMCVSSGARHRPHEAPRSRMPEHGPSIDTRVNE
jgi:hypothetical protein